MSIALNKVLQYDVGDDELHSVAVAIVVDRRKNSQHISMSFFWYWCKSVIWFLWALKIKIQNQEPMCTRSLTYSSIRYANSLPSNIHSRQNDERLVCLPLDMYPYSVHWWVLLSTFGMVWSCLFIFAVSKIGRILFRIAMSSFHSNEWNILSDKNSFSDQKMADLLDVSYSPITQNILHNHVSIR